MNLILLDPWEIDGHGVARLGDARGRHIRTVLRVPPGGTVRIGVVNGPVGRGTVTAVAGDEVRLHCALEVAVPPVPPVDLLLALPRPKVLRRLWPHLAALGVGRVMLTNASKVERDYFDSHYVQPEGIEPLLREGLQQACDTRVPRVTVHKQFRKLVEDDLAALCPDSDRLVAHPGGALRVSQAVTGSRVLIAVGPEGGWNAFERDLLVGHGFRPVSLGLRPLATTAACIAVVALAHDAIR